MTTTTSTSASTSGVTAARSRRPVSQVSIAAGAAALAVIEAYGAIARAAGVPLRAAAFGAHTATQVNAGWLAFGVALGGGTLELVRRTHGGDPALMDFHIAFYVIAAVAVVSTVMFFFLPKNAGAHLTGHGHGAVAVEAAE